MNDLHKEIAKHVADVGAGLIAIGSLAEQLPHIAAGMTILWYSVRLHQWWRSGKPPKDDQ